MEVLMGICGFLTKVHFLRLYHHFLAEYGRGDFDTFSFKENGGQFTIFQDGLILFRTQCSAKELPERTKEFHTRVDEMLQSVTPGESRFMKLLKKKQVTVVVWKFKEPIESIYQTLGRKLDYHLKTKNFTKSYGDGLITYSRFAVPLKRFEEVLIYQVLLSEYQNLAEEILEHNQECTREVQDLRIRENVRYRDIPEINTQLIDMRREIQATIQKVRQLDDLMVRRRDTCTAKRDLQELKLYDFDEMLRLNSYVCDQLDLTVKDISSTIELTQFIYQENEQKELNILQVIFAIGTIATIVSLGAMPGARILLEITGNTVVGEMHAFDPASLVSWTVISVIIGILLFLLLNFIFLYMKRLRIVHTFRKRK